MADFDWLARFMSLGGTIAPRVNPASVIQANYRGLGAGRRAVLAKRKRERQNRTAGRRQRRQ